MVDIFAHSQPSSQTLTWPLVLFVSSLFIAMLVARFHKPRFKKTLYIVSIVGVVAAGIWLGATIFHLATESPSDEYYPGLRQPPMPERPR